MKSGTAIKRLFWVAVVILLSSVLFSSCYYDEIVPEPQRIISGGVSFSDDIIPIFNAECNMGGCHNAGGTAPNLSPGAAYNSLINGNYINTGAPRDSELYQWMSGSKAMPMPLSGPNAHYNTLILQWITEGAKNN